MDEQVLQAIPHRPPFLFVDKILDITNTRIKAIKTISPNEDFFKGHYPGNPIMPGVLICESIFQAGAILLSKNTGYASGGTPVLTRISGAKFKNMVKPGSVLELEAEIIEKVSNAFFMKGIARSEGKTAVTVEFAVSLIQE